MTKKILLLLALFQLLVLAAGNTPFKWERRSDGNGTVFILTVQPGNYVYASSVRFDLKKGDGGAVVPQLRSEPQLKDGEKIFPGGSWQWFTPETGFSGTVEHQGCSDEGICFMPEQIAFSTADAASAVSDAEGDAGKYSVVRKAEGYMGKSEFMNFLRGAQASAGFGDLGVLGIILLTLLGGLGLNLTPCILPMMPVTLIVIGARGGGRNGLLRNNKVN